MKKPYFLVLAIALISCNNQTEKVVEKKESIDPKLLISCDGIGEVKLTDTYADLQKKFGDSVISSHENNVKGQFTSIWANSAKHINVFWKEKKAPYKTIKVIETVDAMAPYMTQDSIGIGMTLRNLVKKNGSMPVTFKNSYLQDDPGYIISFNGGEIPKKNPCFEGIVETVDMKNIHVKEFSAYQKQKTVDSYDKLMERMDVVLVSVRLSVKKK